MPNMGQKIRDLRTNMRLSGEELGRKVGVNKSTISKYELGHSQPSSEVLIRLADVLNCSLEYLIGKEKNTQARSITSMDELDDLFEIREQLRKGGEARILFSATKNATGEDILAAARYLEYLKEGKNRND